MLLDLYSFFWSAVAGLLSNPARTRCQHQRRGFDFDNIEPGETDIFTIEFSDDLIGGREVSGTSFTCSVLATDPLATIDINPSSRILGASNTSTLPNPVDGSLRTFANQKFGGFILGNKYSINAVMTTADGSVLERYSRVYCAQAS